MIRIFAMEQKQIIDMKISRIFTNNNVYYGDNMPCMDSLAYTVQEFLYTSGWAVQRINYGDMGGGYPHILEFDCQMDVRIKLYDFMSIVHYFIDAAYSDFARATIKEYIFDLQQHATEEHTYDVIKYNYELLYITNASNELIVSLLWATWIYVKARNDPYRNASLLFDLINENYPYGVGNLAGNPLVAHADDAVKTMIQHKKDKEEEIRLFEEEMEMIKENTAPAEDENAQTKKEIETLKAENEKLKEELNLLQSLVGAPVETEGHSAVCLELLRLLMDKDGAQLEKHGNKVIAARLMEAITGLALKTCKNYLSDPIVNQTEHQKQILDINSKLQALGMSIRL